MFRRYLFLGLTLVLATVVVYLIVQGRRSEQAAANAAKMKNAEVVLQSPSSEIRAIAPADLRVERCQVRLMQSSGAGGKSSAAVDLELRNSGPTTYHNIMVRISLLGTGSGLIDTRQHLLPDSLAPGAAVSSALIPLDNVPAATTGCKAEVLYADVRAASETAAK